MRLFPVCVCTEVSWWYRVGRWAGLNGSKRLGSPVCHLDGNAWKTGLSVSGWLELRALEQVFQVDQAEDESLLRPSLTISRISILSHSNNSLRPAQIQEGGIRISSSIEQ